jgi:hypothetical protein
MSVNNLSSNLQAEDALPRPSQADKKDLGLPSVYVSAAAMILAIITPIHIQFQPRQLESVLATGMAVIVVLLATLRRNLPLLFASVGALLLVAAAGVVTQPSVLTVPVVAIWPLRMSLVLLIALPWAFLMQPRSLLRRALVAIAVPTFLAILLWGGPATGATLLGWRVPLPQRNFSPFWIAAGGGGTVYATDARGGLVWVFDESGNPKGTIRPSNAPAVPTPGPGIIPVGIEEEINLSGMGLVPTPTPRNAIGTLGFPSSYFEFCGIASDLMDNLYTVDTVDPDGYKLLRFDHDGLITARWTVPEGYEPSNSCLAIDQDHIYLSDRTGKIYVLDYNGHAQKTLDLHAMPFAISAIGDDKLTVITPNLLTHFTVSSGAVITVTLPAPQDKLQTPMLVRRNGETLVTNHETREIVRVNGTTGKVLGILGGPGFLPGQFGDIGGLAEDAQGRLYVTDYQHRVIQRFTPDGRIDAVWWATLTTGEPGETEEGEFE